MPPKKKNKKKQINGFYMYMIDTKRNFEIEYNKDLTMADLVPLAHPGWKVGLRLSLPSPILGPIRWTPSESLALAPGVQKFSDFFHFWSATIRTLKLGDRVLSSRKRCHKLRYCICNCNCVGLGSFSHFWEIFRRILGFIFVHSSM